MLFSHKNYERNLKRTHRLRSATLPVERRSHRRPPQQQGPNDAKPASLVPHATQSTRPEKQAFPNEPRSYMLSIRYPPKTNLAAAPRHPPGRATGLPVPAQHQEPKTKLNRPGLSTPPPNRPAPRNKAYQTNLEVPCFQYQPRENEPILPRPVPPSRCPPVRRRRHAARQRPAEPACPCGSTHRWRSAVRQHPPPNQPGARPSAGGGMPRGSARRSRPAARPRRVARPPPTLLSLSVFTLLASIN
jgi:hypothetical protein